MYDGTIPSKFQFYVSDYMADSVASTYIKLFGIHFWTLSTDVPSSFPVKLDTTALDVFLPGIQKAYGAARPVDVEYKVT